MKTLLLVGALALAVPGVTQTRPAASALSQFDGLSREAVGLLRRALREPDDARALVVLRGPGMQRLLAHREQVKPVVDRWLRPQPEAQKQAFVQELLRTNPLLLYADSLDKAPAVQARLRRCPSLKNGIDGVLLTAMLY